MKRFFVLLFVNIVLVLIQSSVFVEFFSNSAIPNLVLSFSFTLFFLELDDVALLNSLIGGILLDLFSFNIIGISAVVFTGCFLIFIYIKKHLFKGLFINIMSVILSQITYVWFITGDFNFEHIYFSGVLNTLLFSFLMLQGVKKVYQYFFPSGYTFNK